MKKYFVMKGYRDMTSGVVNFQSDSLEDAKDYAALMQRNTEGDYVYKVGTFIED